MIHILHKGSLTIEILIALSILTTSLTSILLLVFSTQTGIGRNESFVHTFLSSAYQHQTARSILQYTPHIEDALLRTQTQIVRTFVSPCSAHILSTTTTTFSLISSLREAQKMASICDPFPPRDSWEYFAATPITVGESASSTDMAMYIRDSNPYLFVTAASASSTLADLFIFDIHEPSLPTLIFATNTGSGLNGIEIYDSYAYVLNNANTEQLVVLDISNLSHITQVAEMSLPKFSFTCTPTTAICLAGKSMTYYDGTLYIGTPYIAFGATSAHNNELHIVCVNNTQVFGCNPLHPIWMGSLNVNHSIHDIWIQDAFAYLATSDDTGELMIVDITDPSALTHPDISGMKFDIRTITGNPSTEDARSIFVLGNTAYIGRQRTNNVSEHILYAFDISTPNAIREITGYTIPLHRSTEYISDIIVQDSLAFISSTDPAYPLSLFKVEKDTFAPQHACVSTNLAATERLLWYNNTIFSAQKTHSLFRTFTHRPSCI